jgi:protein-L-isoaspartate(D-aspartate) O-methyltransferase
MNIEDCRQFYAQEVRFAANVATPGLIEAYERVPREKYLGPGPWQLGSPEQRAFSLTGARVAYIPTSDPRDLYHNVVVAIDASRDINNGQPSALGRWIDSLSLKPGERVYHLGCGVGYYTAIIAEVVGSSGSVMGSEVVPDLASRAKENLASYPNVTVHETDGAKFDPGPCDAILVNAGSTHPLPLWLDALREGGRMVLPITVAATPTLGQGVMVKITRSEGAFAAEVVSVVGIFSCVSARDPQLEPLMAKAFAGGGLLKIKSVRRDIHDQTDTCVLHGREVCLSLAEPVAAREASVS